MTINYSYQEPEKSFTNRKMNQRFELLDKYFKASHHKTAGICNYEFPWNKRKIRKSEHRNKKIIRKQTNRN